MKVTIDTKEDSHEDMYKILHILNSILEKKGSADNFDRSGHSVNTVDTAPMMNMFDDNPSPSVPSSSMAATDKAPDFSSFLSLTKNYEKKDEKPRLEYF